MKKVLIVDDDGLARGALKRALQDAGYDTVEAADGKQGLSLCESEHPDIVIADRRMPEMDGQEMIQAIRAAQWGKTLPIIVLSADEHTAALNEALTANVTAYLSKGSATLEDVVAAVKQIS